MGPLRRYLSILLILAGVAAILGGFSVVPHPFETGYGNHVSPSEAETPPDALPVKNFTELSTDGQYVFLQALHTPDGSVTVYGRESKPPDFVYSHDIHRYVVQYKGSHYVFTGTVQSDFLHLREAFLVATVLVGVATSWLGWFLLKRELRRDVAG